MTPAYTSRAAPDRWRAGRESPYDHAERMLDRYGLAYVCSHPGVLFGSLAPPGADLAEILAGSYRPSASAGGRDTYYHSPPARRIAEAYRVLQYFYAPYKPRG